MKECFGNPLMLLWCLSVAAGLAACSRSGSRSSAGDAPTDIRGEPINAPVSVSTSAAVPASALSSTEGAGNAITSSARNDAAQTDATAKKPPLVQAEQPLTQATKAEEYAPITFDKLASFHFEIPDDQPATNRAMASSKADDQIPPAIKALDEKTVALKGFMLPLRVQNGLVTELLIMRDQSMCCYGTVPRINEWVSVKMINKGVKAIMDQPVTIFGKLRVGAVRENGYLVGIYQMDGQKMAAGPEW